MPHSNLFGISGVKGLVVAVGEGGKILMFQGEHYQPIEAPLLTTHDLWAVFVESEWSAWAVGDAGTVLHWNGERWWPQVLGARLPGPLRAIWGHPDDGLWVGGARCIISRHPTYGSSLYDSDAEVRAIWGRGPDDLWLVCTDRRAMHWNGERCEKIALPGDEDEQWNAVAGTEDGDTYLVGLSGFLLCYTGERCEELPTDTTAILTAAVCVGSSLFVTTDDGLVRQYRRGQWTTCAFSAFGALRSLCHVDGVLWAAGDHGVIIQHRPE